MTRRRRKPARANPLPDGNITDYSVVRPVRLTPETDQAIDAMRGTTNRSTFIRRILERLTHTESDEHHSHGGQDA